MRVRLGQLLLGCALVAAGSSARAADGIESRPPQFAKGISSATVTGSLKGNKTIDYKLRTRPARPCPLR